jgi:hypothetical protein
MGLQAHLQRAFPPSQYIALLAALRAEGVRRRVDQNFDAVSAPHDATTTLAALTCPAAELLPGATMNFRVAGTITNTSTSSAAFTPLIAINGTTMYTDALAVTDTGTAVQAFVMDARITWQTPAVIIIEGLFAVSSDAALPATGTAGSFELPAAIANQAILSPFYHTLSSQIMARDQILTMTMAIPNTATLSASKRIAGLWVE